MNSDLPFSRPEAIAQGSSYYFTGVPCKHGHIAKRYTRNGGCDECQHPKLTKPRVTTDVRYISRSIPFSIDRRIATSAAYLGQLDQYLQSCTQGFVQHLEQTDMAFPMWCHKCEGKGKTIDAKRNPVVEGCAHCQRTGIEPAITTESLAAKAAQVKP